MARWATLCEIAGVSFTGCRAEVVEAEAFLSEYAGSSELANDFLPRAQTWEHAVKGNTFGIRFATTEIAGSLDAVIAAVQAAESSNAQFVVEIADGIFNINVNAIKDYNRVWIELGQHSEGFYETVTLWFQAVSNVTP